MTYPIYQKMLPILNSAKIGLDDPIRASPAARLTKITPIQERI